MRADGMSRAAEFVDQVQKLGDQLAEHPAQTIAGMLVWAVLGAWGHPVAFAVIWACIVDIILGLWKAWLQGNIFSYAMGRGLYKGVIYACVVSLLFVIGRIDPFLAAMCNGLLGLFFMRELVSWVENAFVIGHRMGVDIHGLQVVAKVLRLNVKRLVAEAQNAVPKKEGP